MHRYILASWFFLTSSTLPAQFQRILGPTASTWVLFGESVSMHGNYAIVGEPSRDANAPIYEKVHIYRLNFNGWTRIQTFLSATFAGENDLGGRTGMSENWLVFSQISGTSSFKYFLYQKQADTFALKQTIAHPDPWNQNFVCKTIALTDEHLIVGGAGSAFCYQINATTGLWELKQTITKSGNTEFGSSAAIYENRAVICSNLENAAYAYEFVNGTWVERARLTPNNAAANHHFGSNCAIYKDLIAVTDFGGSYNTNADTSKAYMYKWQPSGAVTQIAALKSPNNHGYSNFGGSYYINDDFLFVGANTDYQNGKVFKFRRVGDTFQYLRQYKTPDPAAQPTFGESIAAFGNQILIGDPTFGILRGAVYQTYVYDSLYAVVNCQLPAQFNGNTIDSTNIHDVFLSDQASVQNGKPSKFGAMNVERLFTDMEDVYICEYSTDSDSIFLDFTQGYQLLVPDGLCARWTTTFQHNGQTLTASDILDDTTSLRPRLVHSYPIGRITLNLEFGKLGQSACKSFPLDVYLGRILCSTAIDTVDMMAGDTITLTNDCLSFPQNGTTYHNWESLPQSPNTFVTTFQNTTRVFPLYNTLYTYTRTLDLGEESCRLNELTYVRVTALDADGDGFPFFLDCDDSNPAVNPSSVEIPFNGLDDDCADGDDGFCIKRQPSPERGQDAMVLSASPTSNQGMNDDLNVGYSTNFTPARQLLSYLKFDLSTLPVGAIIDSAHLSLYWNPTDQSGLFGNGHFDGTGNPGSAQLVIERVTQNWNQNSINWNNKPLISTSNRVTVSHALYPGGTSNFTKMAVTKIVDDQIDPSSVGNLGFRLSISPVNNTRQLIFASSNHPDATIRPKLELCWHADSVSFINEVYTAAQISVYPNPTEGKIFISTPNHDVQYGVIYDMLGVQVREVKLNETSTSIDLAGLPSGRYQIKFDEGSVRQFYLVQR